MPLALSWTSGYQCEANGEGASCIGKGAGEESLSTEDSGDLVCPQLPPTTSSQLAKNNTFGNPPAGWTCDPALYYEADSGMSLPYSCDCGCGVIDPDCGYTLPSCDVQTWNPMYTSLTCEGVSAPADISYCRLDSATCQLLPPGLARGGVGDWTCVPDVYNEMADPGTSLNDCDCNCGGVDPDCQAKFNDIYCVGIVDEVSGAPLPIPRSSNLECLVTSAGTACAGKEDEVKAMEGPEPVVCPQLPATSPRKLNRGSWNKPPYGWTCEPERYYQLDCPYNATIVCDCGCGIIDPDCGFEVTSCDKQEWKPEYTKLRCDGKSQPMDMLYCRLESATCQPLPPGLAKGATSAWTCIPDVYSELSDPGTSLNDCDCNCGGKYCVLQCVLPAAHSKYRERFCNAQTLTRPQATTPIVLAISMICTVIP